MTNNMKNLKSLSLAVLVSVGMVGLALAAPGSTNTRRNQLGQEANPGYGGYSHMRNSGSTEMVVCSGRCLLAAVIVGTGPASTRLAVRNSSVADGSGALVYQQYFQVTPGTEPGNNMVRYPILLDKGITITLSAASTQEEVTAIFLNEAN